MGPRRTGIPALDPPASEDRNGDRLPLVAIPRGLRYYNTMLDGVLTTIKNTKVQLPSLATFQDHFEIFS